MTLGQELWAELQLESEVTRRFLELVPFDNRAFRPAPRSEMIGTLAIHVAEIVGWWKLVITREELNYSFFDLIVINNTEELLSFFDKNLAEAKEVLLNVDDEELEKDWTMKFGNHTFFTLPRKQVLRVFCMNHLIHHRAQLGVYFRLLGIPNPAVYGSSADDGHVTTNQRYNYD